MATNEESASPAGPADRNADPTGSGNGGPTTRRGNDAHTLWSEIRDAISLRAFLLVVGTLGLGVGFVLSYVGALHNPRLQNLPITVVTDNPQATNQLVGQLATSVPHGLIVPSAGTTVAAATEQVKQRDTGAAFIYDLTGTQDRLIVASAAGSAQSTAVQSLFTAVDQREHRTLTVVDEVPAGAKDFDGLSAFYLVVGWCVTGYLIASILGISAGTRPSTTTRAVIRLLAIALSGFVAAIVGTWLVQEHILGTLNGAFWPMVTTGTLLILGVGAITMAMQIALGVLGIGAAVLLVVVLGNPSAGGAFPRSMLPAFWRAIGAFLPPGAGTDAVRSIAYFGGAATGYPLLIMGGYALLGVVLSLLLCLIKAPTSRASGAPASQNA
jgi:hypothetical protein